MGLFEDDANVRSVKKIKVKKETAKKSTRKKQERPKPQMSSLAAKILGKVESKRSLVSAASESSGAVKFEDVDVQKESKSAKVDKGVIQPLINYVSDIDVSV